MKRLILTGDDFGLSPEVNEAIETAHVRGALTAASLMVGAEAAEDAVARARRLPTLRVGLHLVLVRGRPVSPPESIPDLVDETGRLRGDLVGAGFRFFFIPRVRRQLEAEMRAQFAAFARTGLALDHVNAHHHIHLHPTVFGLMLEAGSEFGLKCMRLPYEPFLASWRAAGDGFARRLLAWSISVPCAVFMRMRLDRAGIAHNDFLFGMNDAERLDLRRLVRFVERLPPGISEICVHPSVSRGAVGPGDGTGPSRADELAALTSAALENALRASNVRRIGFADLVPR